MKIRSIQLSAILISLLFLLALTAACNFSGTEQVADSAERRVRVETVLLTPVDVTETFTLPAQLEAREDLLISAEIAGSVVRVQVSEGSHVIAGQTLLEIDADMIRSQLEREQQNVVTLTSQYHRLQRLHMQGLISQQELDNVENTLTAARSALRQAQLQLEKGRPIAPINGIVDRLHVDQGEYVDPGKPLLRLVQVDQLKAVADVPEKDVSFLQTGQQVTIVPATIQGYDLKEVTAVIEHIAFVADDNSRTYRTTMGIDTPTRELRPGMIVRATFVRQEHQQAIAVPLFAVLDRRGKKIVYVVDDDVAREVEVTAGSSIGQQLIIRSGLKAGQQLVIKGHQLLIDGALVRVGSN